MVIVKKQTHKKTPLSIHKDEECDCFDTGIPARLKRCNYRTFPDGWSFVPDIGNAQARGEIFTPRWIVDKMIADSGMLPARAIYEGDYSNPKQEYISSRISEPAVGTANYLSTILYHKLQYAKEFSMLRSMDFPPHAVEQLEIVEYQTNLLIAVASIYAYDIDAGNLEVTKRRLLSSGKQKINIPQTVDQWTSSIVKALNHNPDKKQKIGYSRVKPSIKKSLDNAQKHWYKFVKDGHGIIDTAYREATGKRMPNWLYEQCREILDKNTKLFDGIKESDTLDYANEFFVPGYKTVIWTWWHFAYPHKEGWQPLMSEKEIPLMKMLLQGQLEKVQSEMHECKSAHHDTKQNSWNSKEQKKHYATMQKKAAKIKTALEEYCD